MSRSNILDTKRIQSLTDATFAVAMTILILDVKIPRSLSNTSLTNYFLHKSLPELLIYVLSFVTLGIFWIGSQFHHHLIIYTDRVSSWLNIFFLMVICMIPFSAGFLSEHKHEKLSIVVYSANLIAASILNLFMLAYAWNKKYIKPHFTKRHYKNAMNRVMIPVYMYGVTIIMSYLFPKVALYFLIPPIILHILPESANRSINKVNRY